MSEELRTYSSVATETTPVTGITSVSTAITPTNLSGYPTVGVFAIRIDDESILVGENTGTVFRGLERGYDSSAAVAHSTTSTMKHVAIGADFRNRWQDTVVTRPLGTYDDEFGAATMDSAWTAVTPTGTAVWTQARGVMSAKYDSQSSADTAALVKPFPVLPPYAASTSMRMVSMLEDYNMAGLVMTDGVTSASNMVGLFLYATNTAGTYILTQRYGTLNNISTAVSSNSIQLVGPFLHLRLTWAAVNLFRSEMSSDGVSWINLGWPDVATTFTPTHSGMMVTSWGSTEDKMASFDYYRTEAV